MKSLTVLAFLVSAAALAAPGFAGDSELATLSEPTISGPAGQVEPRQPLEDTTPTTTLAKPTYFSTVEIERIREAVRGQIQALASRDADAAFGYLAPSAQDYYTTPRAFLGTLARDMAPVMTAQRFALAEVEREPGLEHRVHRRQQRLHHVIEEMTEAQCTQHGHCRRFGPIVGFRCAIHGRDLSMAARARAIGDAMNRCCIWRRQASHRAKPADTTALACAGVRRKVLL